MEVTAYDFFNVQLAQPNGRPVTLNGRKFILNRELRSLGRTFSFVYPLDETPIVHVAEEELDFTAHALPCEAIVFWDEVQALSHRQAKLLAT
jgi:hypothetical protein